MKQRKEHHSIRDDDNVVSLFPEVDPVYDAETRKLITTYLASGVASPSNSVSPLRQNMPDALIRAYGLCSPHTVSRAPINTHVHDAKVYADFIRNPYITRSIHVAVACYFNRLPLTYSIMNGLIHEHVKGGVQKGVEIALQKGWLVEKSEHGWPADMCGAQIPCGEVHLRPTRASIYRTIEVINWIIDCVRRVDAAMEATGTAQTGKTWQSTWPNKKQAIADVAPNDDFKKYALLGGF